MAHDTIPAPAPDFTADALQDFCNATDPRARRRLRDQLVSAHMPMAERYVKSMCRRYVEHLPDLYQEGAIGLVEALETFDASKGAQFSSHAYFAIRRRVASALRAGVNGWGYARRQLIPHVSMDAPARADDERSLHEILPALSAPIDERVNRGRIRRRLHRALETLSERDRAVLTELLDHNNLSLAARNVGVSIDTVRAVRKRSLPSLAYELKFGRSSIAPGPVGADPEQLAAWSAEPGRLLDWEVPRRVASRRIRHDDAAAMRGLAESPNTPEKIRGVLVQMYVLGKSRRAAAKALGIPQGTAGWYVRAARAMLSIRSAA